MLLHAEGANSCSQKQASMMTKYHTPNLSKNQCGSTQVRTIDANLPLVWSIIKQFDNPKAYKCFIKRCTILAGDGTGVGSVRKLDLVSGLAANTITERLDGLDDDLCLMVVSRIGGDDMLENYKSTITLHQSDQDDKTILIESYVVDIPSASCKEDTCYFADTMIGFNLRSLAKLTQNIMLALLLN